MDFRDDTENSVLCFLRKGNAEDPVVLVICHFNLNPMPQYSVGVPYPGKWTEVLNSDDAAFGGSGMLNGVLTAKKEPSHGKDHSITFKLAPLCVMMFEGEKPPKKPVARRSSRTAKTIAP
jgi:1,4-alpha-glucan branching enzyme